MIRCSCNTKSAEWTGATFDVDESQEARSEVEAQLLVQMSLDPCKSVSDRGQCTLNPHSRCPLPRYSLNVGLTCEKTGCEMACSLPWGVHGGAMLFLFGPRERSL